MSEKKVKIISTVPHEVSVYLPDLRFSRTWDRQGAEKTIDYEIVEEAMSDRGFYNMIQEGILYIEDMDVKKDLDIEPEDAKEPVNVIVYSDAQIKDFLSKKKSANQLIEALEKISHDQRVRFAQVAVQTRLNDLEKAQILFDYTELDVVSLIKMSIEDEKEEEAEKEAAKKPASTRRKK